MDPLAAGRHVIALDYRGVGASTGTQRGTVEEMAADVAAVIRALGHEQVDLVGFSLGGMVAQELVLAHPGLVRRLVLAGTGPRGGPGIDEVAGTTFRDIGRAALARTDAKEFLFFPRDDAGRAAAEAYLRRLQERTADRDRSVSPRAFLTQLRAITRYGRSAPADLGAITQPTLIANGDHDRMVPSVLSHDLHRRIAGSELEIYPDSGHGGVFQHHERFAPRLVEFLAR